MQMLLDISAESPSRRMGPKPKNRKCEYVGCASPHKTRGLCAKHYQRLRKSGDPSLVVGKPRIQFGNICRVIDCGRLVTAKNLCNTHYTRLARHGNFDLLRVYRTPGVNACVTPGCGRELKGRDYCSKCYARVMRHGTSQPAGMTERRSAYLPTETCSVAGCDSPAKSKNMCRRHYCAGLRKRDPLTYKLYILRRRARVADAYVADYTQEQVQARMDYWGNKCWMCGGAFECIDHVKPIKKGGKDCPANFRPACKSCNSQKSARWYGVSGLHTFVKP